MLCSVTKQYLLKKTCLVYIVYMFYTHTPCIVYISNMLFEFYIKFFLLYDHGLCIGFFLLWISVFYNILYWNAFCSLIHKQSLGIILIVLTWGNSRTDNMSIRWQSCRQKKTNIIIICKKPLNKNLLSGNLEKTWRGMSSHQSQVKPNSYISKNYSQLTYSAVN